MRILVVHNRYREAGGEDRVVDLESALHERHGHSVIRYDADNRQIDRINTLALPGLTIWNHGTYAAVRRLIARERVDVMHVHNTLALVSPAVYYAASAGRTPIVQTLHNYRLFCPSAQCVRNGRVCTDCIGAPLLWPSIRHACYRESRAATASVAAMLMAHRLAGTWRSKIDVYIAPTEFARQLFVTAGLPSGRIVVKPHFVDPDPGAGPGGGGYALYVGRLSEEKGVHTLLDAWSQLEGRVPLTIVGDGPMASSAAEAARSMPGVTWVGRQPGVEVQRLMRHAQFLVFPSVTFETFGQVIAEAYAAGTPVIASDAGAARELVDHGSTGLAFRSGDPRDLAHHVTMLAADARLRASMRAAARAAYEARFTAAASYRALFDIYTAAVAWAGARFQPRVGSAARCLTAPGGAR
jgi:glycosyltransferase involved in cell wall biosynthesis